MGSCVGPEIGTHASVVLPKYRSCGKTKAEVLQAWGEPNHKITRYGQEHWIYKKGLTWRGAVVCVVIIPIPLLVSVGRYKTRLQFEQDSLRSYTTTHAVKVQYGYFWRDESTAGFRWGKKTTDPW